MHPSWQLNVNRAVRNTAELRQRVVESLLYLIFLVAFMFAVMNRYDPRSVRRVFAVMRDVMLV